MSGAETLKITAPLMTLFNDNDKAVGKSVSIEQLYADIKQNLEWILNSRKSSRSMPSGKPYLSCSLLSYGLMDFAAITSGSEQAKLRLCEEIACAITLFETRLVNVSVICMDDICESTRELLLRITAEINMQPNPVAAVFDSWLDITGHSYSFKEVDF